jgi:intracellular multiplication protein IcmK
MRFAILLLVFAVYPISGAAAQSGSNGPGGGNDFQRNLHRIFPVTPSQIQRMREQFGAITGSVGGPAPGAVINATRAVSLKPGTAAPVLQLGRGYVSALRFVDSTGAPWPITSITNGSAHAFSVVRPKLNPPNLLMIDPLTPGAQSDIVVTLKDEDTPILINLRSAVIESSGKNIDGAITYRLDQRGPLAGTPTVQPQPPLTPSPELLSVLDGIAPHGAVAVAIHPSIGAGARIWRIGSDLYLRTDRHLIWPAWVSRMVQDGVRAYRLPRVPSIMLSGAGGTPVSLTLINP